MIWERIEPALDSVRDHCPRLECGMCRRFCVRKDMEDHDRMCNKTEHCTRIDHRNVKFYVPWFKNYDCGCHYPYVCRDFEPWDGSVWLRAHWNGWEDYWGAKVLEAVRDDRCAFVPLVLPYDAEKWTYRVRLWDWWQGTFRNEDGTLKWFERWRPPARGWKPVVEYRDMC